MKKVINAPERVVEDMLRGMELAHGGFVGPGMLDAACAGAVFTSPTPDQMLEASKAVDGGAGVFYVVKNYTGDVLNFEMAGELGEAERSLRSASTPTCVRWGWR